MQWIELELIKWHHYIKSFWKSGFNILFGKYSTVLGKFDFFFINFKPVNFKSIMLIRRTFYGNDHQVTLVSLIMFPPIFSVLENTDAVYC